MNIDRLTYSKLFPTGSYSNERIEVSCSLSDNEDIIQVYSELHNMVKDLHFSQNKELYEQMGVIEKIVEQSGSPLNKTEELIRDINSCKELKVLQSYRLIVKNNPQLKEAYEIKLIELNKIPD